jgi:hypothetical protein
VAPPPTLPFPPPGGRGALQPQRLASSL